MVKLTPKVIIGATDVSRAPDAVTWTEWKSTFCLLPRKDITGTFIIGPIWYRMQETRIHEYEDDIGHYVSSDLGFIEYARTKKDIFLRSLKEHT